MKYIRTENGIFEFEGFHKKCINHYGYTDKNGVKVLMTLSEAKEYKQADTIEQLCDEFVWREITFDKGKDYKGYDCLIHQDYERDEHEITQDMIREGIYGAIWTEWGLIYVAKMNEKGELELL